MNGERLYLLIGFFIVLYTKIYKFLRAYFVMGCRACIPNGAIQGLPITPHFLITIVDAGLYVVYATRMRCPCLHHCYECSEMHSRLRMLIVFTDDPMSFHEQLKGPSQTS